MTGGRSVDRRTAGGAVASPLSRSASASANLPVLVALRDGGADTQRDLARFARIEQPPMAQMLARMERDELIRREPDPADGRSRRVTLAEAAVARLPAAIETLLQGNREALRGFSPEETDQFTRLLKRLIGNLDTLAGAETDAAPAE